MDGPDPTGWSVLLPLFRELNDLKRIRSPELLPSIAGAWFPPCAAHCLHGPASGDPARRRDIALQVTARALAATRLGAITAADLEAGGMGAAAREAIFGDALAERQEALESGLAAALSAAMQAWIRGDTEDALDASMNRAVRARTDEDWLQRLVDQPRAGATAPGMPRIVLEPVESCAEHCFVTAVYAVLLAPHFGADIADAFEIGLAHHAHNARLPDAGFAGEAVIGERLDGLVATLREQVLSTLPPAAAERLRGTFAAIETVDTPLARTFHAADSIDRVLQIDYFAQCNRFTLDKALDDMDLVHAGPVQAFQLSQLDAAGLGGA